MFATNHRLKFNCDNQHYTTTVEPLYNRHLWEQCFGLYTEVAFVERLFCTQTGTWVPGRYVTNLYSEVVVNRGSTVYTVQSYPSRNFISTDDTIQLNLSNVTLYSGIHSEGLLETVADEGDVL